MKFGTDIYVRHRMNCKYFGDPLTFPVALVYDQIPEKLFPKLFPSASAVFCVYC